MDEFPELHVQSVRKVYLITYSRANEDICGTRQAFADIVLQAFSFETGAVRPLHWVVSREPHEGGGFHFHMAISLSSNKRWLSAKRAMEERGVVVHFQDREDVYNYVGAYIYVCKIDRNVLHSTPHPDLSNVTQFRTAAASAANRNAARRRRRRGSGNEAGASRNANAKPTKLNVMQIIKAKDICSETALLALAKDNFDEGHTSLIEFIANTPEKTYKELIAKTWKMETAKQQLHCANIPRMQLISDTYDGQCIAECGDEKVCPPPTY